MDQGSVGSNACSLCCYGQRQVLYLIYRTYGYFEVLPYRDILNCILHNNGEIIMSKFQAQVVHVGQEKHTVPTNQQEKKINGNAHYNYVTVCLST